jgi:hypothetical protein
MNTNSQRQILINIAIMSNRLAHESTGELQDWAFTTKNDAVSELIVRGWARANCKRATGTVGVTMDGENDGKPRLHVRPHLLKPEACARVREQSRSIRATASLRECLDFAEIALMSAVGGK